MKPFRQPTSGGGAPVARPGAGPVRPGGARVSVPGKRATSGAPARSSGLSNRLGGLLFNASNDTNGLKLGPTVVLVMSLLFIAFVILLHVWGKFRR